MDTEKKNNLSPWTALIFGFSGIIVSAIVVGGVIAWKALDKVENQDELMDLLCQNLQNHPENKLSCDR